MDLKEIVSISGLGGLFHVVAQRQDGLIVRNLTEEQSKFVSSRIHMFTPLDSITIYTTDDSVELRKVLETMKEKSGELAVPRPKDSSNALKTYFKSIQPDYDEERVYVSDIKKVIKWYNLLDEHDLLEAEEEEEAAKAATEIEDAEENQQEDTTTLEDNQDDQPVAKTVEETTVEPVAEETEVTEPTAETLDNSDEAVGETPIKTDSDTN